MKWLVAILLLNVTQGAKHCKDIVKFDGKFYKKEFLADGIVSKPFFMTYLESNQIIFSQDSEPLGNTSTYILDLNTKDLKEINADKAVVNGVNENGTIYIGQDGGLFTYNKQNDKLTFEGLKDIVFYALLIKVNKIYYTDYPLKDLYVFEDGVSKLISGLGINDIVFDDKDNLFYFNKTGVYVQMSNEVVHFNAMEYDEVPLVGLTYDKVKDLVYATSVFGVFKLDLGKRELSRISMKIMFDIVFDPEGNIIFSDEESIVRLKSTELTCL